VAEARVVVEGWRRQYNTVRPHSSLDYRPPAPEAVLWPAMPSEPAPDVALKPTMRYD
jgi:transposase InsO family protein